MSYSDLDPIAGRMGRLDCVCAPGEARGSDGGEGLLRLAAGFGLAILAQTLVLAALPMAAAIVAPRPGLAGVPYAIALLGAALATFPASYLLDAFGRRAAFALGASLGAAGGVIAGWAALHRQFALLCLGALWLGLAHGFALFYRHAAATSATGPRGGAIVFAGGALAALVAPSLLQAAATLAGPFADAATLGAAGVVDLLGLVLAVTLPHALAGASKAPRTVATARSFYVATGVGAVAWFVMTLVMAAAAPALAGCGATAAAIGGAIAWHLVAMYAPAALIRLTGSVPTGRVTLAVGAILLAGGALAFVGAGGVLPVAGAMIAAGVGWSLVNAGLLQWLYDGGVPTRGMLAAHDFALLGAAMIGALLAPSA
ncbi:MAG: MFS transporter [Hyphomicrobiales bacterium]|nr:MFS transporter [Hyphomicrobiales bacterium]